MMASPGRAVVLTRPAAQARALAEQLGAAGFPVLLFPALAIGPARDLGPLRAAFDRLEQYDLVIFVSPNAIDYALGLLPTPWPAQVAIGVMGPGSVKRLALRGIVSPPCTIVAPDIKEDGRLDSEALLERLNARQWTGKRCLIVRGNGGRDFLSSQLEKSDAAVEIVESYERSEVIPAPAAAGRLVSLIEHEAQAVFVVTSSQAITALLHQIGALAPNALDWFLRQPILATHARIAENATAAGFARVHLAMGGDDGLADALKCLPDARPR